MTLSWEVLFGVGVVILFLGLIYGAWQYRTRNKANDKVAQQVVRDRYKNPEKGI